MVDMTFMHDIRNKFVRELKEMYEKKDNLTPECVQVMKNLIDGIKDIDTIFAMQEGDGYSQRMPYERYFNEGNSYARTNRYGGGRYSQHNEPNEPLDILMEMLRTETDPRKTSAISAAIANMQR